MEITGTDTRHYIIVFTTTSYLECAKIQLSNAAKLIKPQIMTYFSCKIKSVTLKSGDYILTYGVVPGEIIRLENT